jgi:hypothetical protein
VQRCGRVLGRLFWLRGGADILDSISGLSGVGTTPYSPELDALERQPGRPGAGSGQRSTDNSPAPTSDKLATVTLLAILMAFYVYDDRVWMASSYGAVINRHQDD